MGPPEGVVRRGHTENSLHRRQQFIQMHPGETGGGVAHRVGNDQFTSLQQRATDLNHVRNIAFAFGFERHEVRRRGFSGPSPGRTRGSPAKPQS